MFTYSKASIKRMAQKVLAQATDPELIAAAQKVARKCGEREITTTPVLLMPEYRLVFNAYLPAETA